MMFAYTFNRNSYEDVCEMSKLQYQFDAHGSYILLEINKHEYRFDAYNGGTIEQYC